MRKTAMLAMLALSLATYSQGAAPPRGGTFLPEQPLPEGALMRLGTTVFRSSLLSPECCLSRDGRYVAVGQKEGIRVWDLHTRTMRAYRHGTTAKRCEPVEFSSDGKLLAVLHWGGRVTGDRVAVIFELSSGSMARTLRWREREVWSQTLRFVPGKNQIVRMSYQAGDGGVATVEAWDLDAKRGIHRSTLKQGTFPIGADLLLAPGSKSCSIRVLRLPFLKQLEEVDTGLDSISCKTISADGQRIAYKRSESELWVRDRTSGKSIQLEKALGRCHHLALSPTGRFLYGADYDTKSAAVWETTTGRHLVTVRYPTPQVMTPHVAFSPNESRFAFEGTGGIVAVHELPSGELLSSWRLPSGLSRGLAFAPDGRTLMVKGSSPGFWDLTGMAHSPGFWDVLTGYPVLAPPSHLSDVSLDFMDAGNIVLTGDDHQVYRFWNTKQGKQILPPLGGFPLRPEQAHVTLGGREYHTVDLGGTLRAFDLRTARLIHQERLPTRGSLATGERKPVDEDLPVNILSFADEGSYAYTDEKKRIFVRHRPTNQTVTFPLPEEKLEGVKLSSDGRFLAAYGQKERTLALYDVIRRRRVFLVRGYTPQRSVEAFSPCNRWFVWPQDDRIRRLDLRTGKEASPLTRDVNELDFAHFRAGGKLLVTLAAGRLCLWDIESGRQVVRHSGVVRAEVSERNALLAWSKLDEKSYLLDLLTGRELVIPELRRSVSGWDVSLDDRTLAAFAGERGTFYETLTGNPIVLLPAGHLGAFSCVAFSPDGSTLGTGGEDTTVLLWDWKRLCRLTGQRRGRLDPHRLAVLWHTLKQEDARDAYRAMGTLIAHPDATMKLLERELAAVSTTDLRSFHQLVRDLDSDEFSTRQVADKRLGDLPLEWVYHLRRSRDSKPSLEVRLRLDRLLGRTADKRYSPDMLRRLRAVLVLEEIGSPEARSLLDRLAKGHEDSTLTQQAKSALARLAERKR